MLKDPKAVMERVRHWQNNLNVQPLTCGNDTNHRKLEPVESNGLVVLCCPDCGYEQPEIPAVVLLNPPQ